MVDVPLGFKLHIVLWPNITLLRVAVHPPRACGRRTGHLRGVPGELPCARRAPAKHQLTRGGMSGLIVAVPPRSLALGEELWRGDRQGAGASAGSPPRLIEVPALPLV